MREIQTINAPSHSVSYLLETATSYWLCMLPVFLHIYKQIRTYVLTASPVTQIVITLHLVFLI